GADVTPLLNLDVDRHVRVLGLEVGVDAVDHGRGRAAVHEPDGQRAGLVRRVVAGRRAAAPTRRDEQRDADPDDAYPCLSQVHSWANPPIDLNAAPERPWLWSPPCAFVAATVTRGAPAERPLRLRCGTRSATRR